MNVQRVGMGSPERLVLRKARASCPTFLGAKPGEAKVRLLQLLLIGDILSPGRSWWMVQLTFLTET